MNSDLKAVCDWAVENKLVLNVSKSKAIVIGAKDLLSVPPTVMFGVEIMYSRSVKNLGMVMNSSSSWIDHANKVSQRIFIGLRSLWPLSKSTPAKTRHMLAKALLLPHIDYCSAVYYHGLDAASFKVLNDSMKSIVRYVYGLGRYDSADQKIISFLGCSLDIFLKVRAMTFLYKLDRSGKPTYLNDLLQRGPSVRSRQFVIQRSHKEIGKKTLFVNGFAEWNLIPLRIKNCSSVNVFRNQCTDFFNRRSNNTIYG